MRLSIKEYQNFEIRNSPLSSFSEDNLVLSVKAANNQIKSALGWGGPKDALSFSNGFLRASGIAGIVRLNRDVELEILPAHFPTKDGTWKESLFFLSILSRYGSELLVNTVKGQSLQWASLYDLCGLILVKEFQLLRRSFIRMYQHRLFKDYSIEGDIIFDSLYDNTDGFLQNETLLHF